MATMLLPVATGAANSADFVVTNGIPVTVFLKGADGGYAPFAAKVFIEIKDDADKYMVQGVLTHEKPGCVIVGPGTYRVRREANDVGVGVCRG